MQAECVDRAVLRGESPIRGGPFGRLLIGEHAVGLLRRPFLREPPWSGAVDALTVRAQPIADTEQQLTIMVGDRTVRTRTYVQQQITVLRYRVDQRDDQLSKRLVLQRVRVAPRITGDCGIRLPDERRGIGKTSAFHVDDARAPGETVVLIAD